jgi:hypothetical protein
MVVCGVPDEDHCMVGVCSVDMVGVWPVPDAEPDCSDSASDDPVPDHISFIFP